MAWSSLLPFLLTISITPGPNNLLCMATASRHGPRAALPYGFGVAVGLICLYLLVIALGERLTAFAPGFVARLPLAGAAFMVYLAVMTLRDAFWPRQERKTLPRPGFWAGVTFQFLNPKALLGCLSIVGAYLLPAGVTVRSTFELLAVSALLALGSTQLWAWAGGTLARLFGAWPRGSGLVVASLLLWAAWMLARTVM